MKRFVAASLTVVLSVSALAVSGVSVSETFRIEVAQNNPWTSLGLNNRPENFRFAIVSDRTGGHRSGVFPAALAKINRLQPEFVMSVGDLIEGGTEDLYRVEAEWEEFNWFVNRLDMPFFYVPGNHDLTNAAMIPVWQSQFGRTYYHFVYHDVLFVALNSEDPPNYQMEGTKPGNIGPEQLAWLGQVLRSNSRVRWTIVFVHKPMWHHGERSNWHEVEALLGDRPRTVFAGHEHRYAKTQVDEHTYYALATTGGVSNLEGPAAGRFDHIVWVTMTSTGPRVANLMLDGIWTDDPVQEAQTR